MSTSDAKKSRASTNADRLREIAGRYFPPDYADSVRRKDGADLRRIADALDGLEKVLDSPEEYDELSYEPLVNAAAIAIGTGGEE